MIAMREWIVTWLRVFSVGALLVGAVALAVTAAVVVDARWGELATMAVVGVEGFLAIVTGATVLIVFINRDNRDAREDGDA